MRPSPQFRIVLLLGLFSLISPLLQPINYLFRRKAYRYYCLGIWVEMAIRRGNYEKAGLLAQEWLSLAPRFGGWNYGNAIHDSHQALGLAFLKRGEVEKAKKHLLLAGRTPGSPQLNSYGPQMILGRELLKMGEKEIVIEYLNLVRRFWAKSKKGDSPNGKVLAKYHKVQLEQWKADISEGKIPHHQQWF